MKMIMGLEFCGLERKEENSVAMEEEKKVRG